MPNWTDNTLIIAVPADRADAFCKAIEGPNDWPYPIDALSSFERPSVGPSAHQKLKVTGEIDNLMARFRAHHDNIWPDWMKPSFVDLALFMDDPEYRKKTVSKTVPFSIPALTPWKDKAEFDRFFPEEDPSDPLWTGTPDNSRIIALRKARIGVKWPPGSIRLEREDKGDLCRITIHYETPWAPIESLADIMADVLATHNARAALLWIEEQGYCGYEYMLPGGDSSADAFEADRFVEEIEEDDDEVFHQFDREDFETTVADIISDEALFEARNEDLPDDRTAP